MNKLPGSALLLVGLFVTIGSVYIDRVRFFLFALIGAGMVILGVIRTFSQNKKKQTVKQPRNKPHPMVQHHGGPTCKVCNYRGQSHDRFCSQCGFPLVRFS